MCSGNKQARWNSNSSVANRFYHLLTAISDVFLPHSITFPNKGLKWWSVMEDSDFGWTLEEWVILEREEKEGTSRVMGTTWRKPQGVAAVMTEELRGWLSSQSFPVCPSLYLCFLKQISCTVFPLRSLAVSCPALQMLLVLALHCEELGDHSESHPLSCNCIAPSQKQNNVWTWVHWLIWAKQRLKLVVSCTSP